MLMASKTIAESFRANIGELSAIRTTWTAPYADELVGRIDAAISGSLGIDPKKQLREATASVVNILAPARRDVSFFKTQIDQDFKKEPAKRNEILNSLGFAILPSVQKGNQEALLQLLSAYKTNMTAVVKQEIVAKGMNASLIDTITGYAEVLIQANTSQENLKGSTKNITSGVVDTFNLIYDEIMAICRIAANYYRFEPLKKEQFTFAKVISNLGGSRKTTAAKTTLPVA